MKAAIHNPYIDTLGGGERYTLAFAKVLSDRGYQVDLEWKSPNIISLLENRFGFSLDKINVTENINRGDGYDLCFWVSDGSIPALRSRKNLLHFQVPFQKVKGKSLMNRMKLFRVNRIICNSKFTKKIIDAEFGINSLVIYPPVSVSEIKPKRKENIILNVSRFSKLMQSKHQDILVKVFKKFVTNGNSDWKLVLAGGAEVGDGGYTDELIKMSDGYPIDIIKNPGFKFIRELYGKAKLFWSASGFGIDENQNPMSVEHFGITAVEAMAGGAVPLVYNAGGYKEIVEDGSNGFLWTKESELLKISEKLINNKSLFRRISLAGVTDSLRFSYEKFESDVGKIL